MVKVVLKPEPGMKIGVVSDTHGYFDPKLRDVLKDVRAILHAGDVGSAEVLAELQAIAPVHAVRGNVDGSELSLPLTAAVEFDGLHVEMMHILPVPQSELKAWGEGTVAGGKAPMRSERFLATFKPETGMVIFGHSHEPCLVSLGDRLFFNPGSAGRKRFSLPRCCGIMEVAGGRLWASVVPLEKNGPPLPERVSFEIEVPHHVESEKN